MRNISTTAWFGAAATHHYAIVETPAHGKSSRWCCGRRSQPPSRVAALGAPRTRRPAPFSAADSRRWPRRAQIHAHRPPHATRPDPIRPAHPAAAPTTSTSMPAKESPGPRSAPSPGGADAPPTPPSPGSLAPSNWASTPHLDLPSRALRVPLAVGGNDEPAALVIAHPRRATRLVVKRPSCHPTPNPLHIARQIFRHLTATSLDKT